MESEKANGSLFGGSCTFRRRKDTLACVCASGGLEQEGQLFNKLGPQTSPNATNWIMQVHSNKVVIALKIHSFNLAWDAVKNLVFPTLTSPKNFILVTQFPSFTSIFSLLSSSLHIKKIHFQTDEIEFQGPLSYWCS